MSFEIPKRGSDLKREIQSKDVENTTGTHLSRNLSFEVCFNLKKIFTTSKRGHLDLLTCEHVRELKHLFFSNTKLKTCLQFLPVYCKTTYFCGYYVTRLSASRQFAEI